MVVKTRLAKICRRADHQCGSASKNMPKKFDSCAKHGGKVRTKQVPGGYLHICKSRSGKWSAGHFHHKR